MGDDEITLKFEKYSESFELVDGSLDFEEVDGSFNVSRVGFEPTQPHP